MEKLNHKMCKLLIPCGCPHNGAKAASQNATRGISGRRWDIELAYYA